MAMGEAIDQARFYGKSEGEPFIGLFNKESRAEKKALTGAFPSYKELVDLETTVAPRNADIETMRFKIRPDLRGHARLTPEISGNSCMPPIWEPGNTLNGYATDITNQLGKGDLVFDDFTQIIVMFWGGLEINFSHNRNGGDYINETWLSMNFGILNPQTLITAQAAPETPAGQ